jgi:hypothetical protein
MNIKDFQDSLEYLFKAEVTGFVWGHAGIGKSSIIKQYAAKKGYYFFPLYLGTQSDLGDVLGLADFVRDENGTAVATTFATPIWLKNAIDHCNNNPDSGAIIFLDEFNRARRDVLNGMFSLALDKTFHTIKLPKNCHVIAAGNPPTEEYYTTDVDDTALMARFAHIKLEPTVQEWVEFAKVIDMDPTLVSFIEQQPQLLEDAKSTFALPIKVDRRAYERLNKLFKVETPTHLLEQLMSGIIGIERLIAYKQHLSNSVNPLSADEILKGERMPDLMSWCTTGSTKASLLNKSTDNLKAHLIEMSKKGELLTEDQQKTLLNFFLTIPKESTFATLRNLMFQEHVTVDNFCNGPIAMKKLAALIRTVKGVEEKPDEKSKK